MRMSKFFVFVPDLFQKVLSTSSFVQVVYPKQYNVYMD